MGPPLAWNNSTAQKAWRTTRLAEPERSQPKIDFSENHLRCELMENEYCSASASCSLNHAACTVKLAKTMSYNLLFEQGNSFFFFFFSFLLAPEKEQQMNPTSLSVMVFWFQFPISSLSQFDKVTSRCHLQYPTPFTQAPWNAIINRKYCPDRLWLFQRGKHQCLLFGNQTLAPGASRYLSSLGEKKKSPTGITNPLLVCSAVAIQHKKIIPVAAYNLDLQMKW